MLREAVLEIGVHQPMQQLCVDGDLHMPLAILAHLSGHISKIEAERVKNLFPLVELLFSFFLSLFLVVSGFSDVRLHIAHFLFDFLSQYDLLVEFILPERR